MPYKSEAQRRYLHAEHPEIAAQWDREEKRDRGKHAASQAAIWGAPAAVGGGVLAGKRGALAAGLSASLSGGVSALARRQKLPERVTQGKAVTMDGVEKSSNYPMIDRSERPAWEQKRRRLTAEEVAYGGAAAAAGLTGTGLASSKWMPDSAAKKVSRALNSGAIAPSEAKSAAALAGKSVKEFRPGDKFSSVRLWARSNPRKSTAAVVGLKTGAIGAALAARYRRDEQQGIGHTLGEGKANERNENTLMGKSYRFGGSNIREFEHLPENVHEYTLDRSWARNPVSPLDMYAASAQVSRFVGRGSHGSRKAPKYKFGPEERTYRLNSARMMLFSPLGQGTIRGSF